MGFHPAKLSWVQFIVTDNCNSIICIFAGEIPPPLGQLLASNFSPVPCELFLEKSHRGRFSIHRDLDRPGKELSNGRVHLLSNLGTAAWWVWNAQMFVGPHQENRANSFGGGQPKDTWPGPKPMVPIHICKKATTAHGLCSLSQPHH